MHYKVHMNAIRRTVAATEVLLIFPAVLFMTALFVRNLQPQPAEPAHTAQHVVMWYASLRGMGLWGLLILPPLAVFVLGCATLVSSWTADAELRATTRQTVAAVREHFAIFLVAVATLTSAFVLAAIGLHVLSD